MIEPEQQNIYFDITVVKSDICLFVHLY